MNPTEILKNEHRVIEQVLDCLEKIAERGRTEGRLDGDSAREAIEFFRVFADGCHHGKEETHLFPALEAKGFPREGGPTGVMRSEHETGRGHIRGMAAAVEAAAEGDRRAVDDFADNAQGYIELLREHIQKEDHCLFNMADHAFTPREQAELLAQFERVESHEVGEGVHERYLALADRLAERWGVTKGPRGVAAVGGCGHHHG